MHFNSEKRNVFFANLLSIIQSIHQAYNLQFSPSYLTFIRNFHLTSMALTLFIHKYCILIIVIFLRKTQIMNLDIRQNYDEKANRRENQAIRQQKATKDLLSFNNWVKSVLISQYSKKMYTKLESVLDINRQRKQPLLHVLDIGCGRGQDILKWGLAKVRYMVASDFSEESIKVYQERWRAKQPFRLYLISADFTKLDLYNKIEHSFYDIVSAQFCLHYMFKTKQDLTYGLANILSNLLIDGVFIATIPDSYTILKKIKEKGKKVNGCTYFSNKFCSLRFTKTEFTEEYGNQYGFYLQQSIGDKNEETGQISYTNQWLISLDALQKILQTFGVEIEYTKNFIEFYLEYRNIPEYQSLFGKVGLNFPEGKSMDNDLWEIAHMYRVLICRKKSKGKQIKEFNFDQRIKSTKGKQIQRSGIQSRGRSNNHNGYNNNYNSRGRNHYSNSKYSNKH